MSADDMDTRLRAHIALRRRLVCMIAGVAGGVLVSLRLDTPADLAQHLERFLLIAQAAQAFVVFCCVVGFATLLWDAWDVWLHARRLVRAAGDKS